MSGLLAGTEPPQSRFVLETRDGRLELRARHHPEYGTVAADWASDDVRRRVRGGRRQLLARAIGLHKARDLEILDATAGFGRDAYVLAALGARVVMAERHPLMLQLLADAMRRAAGDPAVARLQLHAGDAAQILSARTWDAVYLDPMYPGEGRTALARKEMQFLQELTAGDAPADTLLPVALRQTRRRVVVKRPLKAPPLAGPRPDLDVAGSQTRFDIYLPRPRSAA